MNTILRLGVYDSPGALDRIAGLIRRNGLNITSVNAGTFKNGTAQISIVLTDARADVNKLGKQLYDINFVADYKVLGAENACIRELALIRMKASDFDGGILKGPGSSKMVPTRSALKSPVCPRRSTAFSSRRKVRFWTSSGRARSPYKREETVYIER